eukprot:407285-Amphidinium_carterae.1
MAREVDDHGHGSIASLQICCHIISSVIARASSAIMGLPFIIFTGLSVELEQERLSTPFTKEASVTTNVIMWAATVIQGHHKFITYEDPPLGAVISNMSS